MKLIWVDPMEKSHRWERLVRFDAFELDLRSHELRKHGQKIKLQEQPFQILATLLERLDDVVTREELRQKLWPADTFVDFDHSLNTAIKKLREALGDSAGSPRFVETLARRGYRFIAAVDHQNQADEPDTTGSSVSGAPVTLEPGPDHVGPWRSEREANHCGSPPMMGPLSPRRHSQPPSWAAFMERLEPVGGAVPLNSPFYIIRPADEEFRFAIARQDSIVLVKGMCQVGKTSLLARGLQQAREAGATVVLTEFQKLNAAHLESADSLYRVLAEMIADQLDLDVMPDGVWNPRRGPSINFERYICREVLGKIPSPLVWGLDEVDRLFPCNFRSDVFGLFRSWHNERSLVPAGPWQRLTLAMAYATEAHLFISDINQSLFNVGTRLVLEDFTFEQVAELNQRYASPLRGEAEVARYFRLVGGHPYLVRRGLHEMAAHGLALAGLEALADRDDGPFGDHLRRMRVLLFRDPVLCEVVRGVLRQRRCPSAESFYRLRSAGLLSGHSAGDVRPRCQLYAAYLEKHLL